MTNHAPKIVALGGGHGLAATLSSLAKLDVDITAVVTVADDGGSSGRLRGDFDILPPGDLRMALASLCPDTTKGTSTAELLQYRFADGSSLAGHPIGNLILTALWQLEDNPVDALTRAAELVNARGTVLPMSNTPLSIEATVESSTGELHRIRGQATVARTIGRIRDLSITPLDPPACPEALAAIAQADWIILGPGSWYTSIMPALLIRELREAMAHSSAKKLLIVNLQDELGETEGLDPAEHIQIFGSFAGDLRLDSVLVDSSHEHLGTRIARNAAVLGADTIFASVRCTETRTTHNPELLSRVLHEIVTRVR